jgi:putative transcriptional regulator
MTPQGLATAISVARQTIIAMEQGKFCPSLELALRIAQVFGIPVDGYLVWISLIAEMPLYIL